MISFVMGPMLIVALVNLCLALLLPFCGYQGAKSNDKNLICCFCGPKSPAPPLPSPAFTTERVSTITSTRAS